MGPELETVTRSRAVARESERPGGPMTPEAARETIAETLARLGVAETALGAVSATMARQDRTSLLPMALPLIEIDPETSDVSPHVNPDRRPGDPGPDLVARRVLGKGGMGLVRLAAQRSLEREVAVKTSARSNAAATRALVREAQITGGLEHPNVVPVHALGVDREGGPLLVMKRIEGVSWRTLIKDDAHEAWKPLLAGHGDRMRAHVEILAQVTRALEIAHDRGVVHRDVKSENVMIGRFGEVYLLDWGVALRLSERDTEPHGIVGTPGFLAPEMARSDPALVGTHTDVYLLGATLYEVLTRRPPHDAPNALAALVAALVGDPPPVPAEAPRELVMLLRRAMAHDPSERMPSAAAFREGLARYLASREADLVLAEGRAALVRAEVATAADGPGAPDAFRALIEARFALAATFRARADADSRAELDGCLARLVERELALRSPGGARTLLGEMGTVPPALTARVVALERSLLAERAAAEDRERARSDADSSRSVNAMIATVASIIALVVVAYGLVAWDGELDGLPASGALLIWTAALVAFSVVAFLARRQIMTNAKTRVLGGFLALALLTPFGCTLVALELGAPMYQRSAYSWIASAGLAALGELGILPQIWPCALVYVAGTIAVLAEPTWAYVIQPFVILSNLAIFVRALRRHAASSRVGSTS